MRAGPSSEKVLVRGEEVLVCGREEAGLPGSHTEERGPRTEGSPRGTLLADGPREVRSESLISFKVPFENISSKQKSD